MIFTVLTETPRRVVTTAEVFAPPQWIKAVIAGAEQLLRGHSPAVFDTASQLPPVQVDVERVSSVFPRPRDWHPESLCSDEIHDENFFGVENEGQPSLSAKALHQARSACSVCPVRRQCLTQALVDNEQYGVWGGTSARQREKVRPRIRRGEEIESLVTEMLRRGPRG